MGRYRAGASGYRRNGQRRCGAFRVTHRQNRVGGGGFYNSHANDLGAAGIPACYGVSKIRPIEGKDQLASFGDTNLEQHLISADVCQVERIRAKAGNAPGAVRAVLGEADIRPGGDGSRIVRGHQGIEIGIGEYATGRTLRPNRASFSGRALGAGSARCTDGTNRASRTGFTDRSLRAGGAGSAGFSSRALGANRARLSGRALGADGAGHTGRALHAYRPGYTGRALGPNWALFTGRALGANRALYAGRALGASRPGDPGRACWANAASLPYRPLRANRAGDPCRALHTGRPSWPRYTLRPHRPSWPNGALRPCRTLRTHRALGVNGVLGHIRVSVAAASIQAGVIIICLVIALAVLIYAERIVILISEAFVSTHSIPSLLGVYFNLCSFDRN